MVIDLGAETSTVLKINDRGRVTDWAGQDKCAAGTGMFLQAMAKVMQVNLDEMAEYSLRAKNGRIFPAPAPYLPNPKSSPIFTGSLPLPKRKSSPEFMPRWSAALWDCSRGSALRREVAVVGGVARNKGLVDILEKELGIQSPGAGKSGNGGCPGCGYSGQRKYRKEDRSNVQRLA